MGLHRAFAGLGGVCGALQGVQGFLEGLARIFCFWGGVNHNWVPYWVSIIVEYSTL